MKKDRKHYFGILIGAILIIIAGILIVVFRKHLLLAIMVAAGITIFVDGVYTLFNFKGWNLVSYSLKMAIIKGVIQIVIGLLGIFLPIFVGQELLATLVYIIAIVLVISALISFENAIAFKKTNKGSSISNFIASGVTSLLLAIILFINPTGILSTIVSVLGILIILAGVGMLVWSLRIRKMLKSSSETVIESSFEEVDSDSGEEK